MEYDFYVVGKMLTVNKPLQWILIKLFSISIILI